MGPRDSDQVGAVEVCWDIFVMRQCQYLAFQTRGGVIITSDGVIKLQVHADIFWKEIQRDSTTF